MTERRDLLRLAALVVVLLVVTGATMLATQGGGSGSDAPSESKVVDGLVLEATPVALRLRPSGGSGEMRFEIRAVDRPSFDIVHLQQHAAEGLLTRVTYLQEGSRLFAVRADDAPPPPGG